LGLLVLAMALLRHQFDGWKPSYYRVGRATISQYRELELTHGFVLHFF